MNELIINFTPTGMIPTKEITPHVPETPAEIIEQVHEVFEIGITIVHLHARADDGKPEYRSEVYHRIIEGVRKFCPGIVVGVSLSGRFYKEFERRSEVLELKPDMGSLTLSSLNFTKEASVNTPEMIINLAEKMKAFGVNPELECFDNGMINFSKYLIKRKLIHAPYYYNILLGGLFTAQVEAGHIASMINSLPDDSFWSLAGIGSDQLKANSIAIALGGGVRIGIEDNIWYDMNKTILASNKELVLRIHQLAEIHERNIMKSRTFGKLGFYNRLT